MQALQTGTPKQPIAQSQTRVCRSSPLLRPENPTAAMHSPYLASEVLNLKRVDVQEHSVNGEVTAKSVLHRRSEPLQRKCNTTARVTHATIHSLTHSLNDSSTYHRGDATVVSVRLLAQVHKVNEATKDLDCRSFQVLGLVPEFQENAQRAKGHSSKGCQKKMSHLLSLHY